MRFTMMVLKVSRMSLRDISTSALGTTLSTSESPSARMSASSGATTVVLPAPMIICFTMLRPPATAARKLFTMLTCLARSRMFHTNSKLR